ATSRRQLDTGRCGAQEGVRDLQQDSGAVASIRVGALGPPMLEVLERVERLLDDRVAGLSPQLRDQRDPAAVVLVGWVVEASGPWRSGARIHLEKVLEARTDGGAADRKGTSRAQRRALAGRLLAPS